MVDGIAFVINLILGASDTFRDNGLCFVSEEAVNSGFRIRDEVEAVNLKLVEAISSAS